MLKLLMPALAGVLIGILGQHLGHSIIEVVAVASVTGGMMGLHLQLNK